MSIVCRRWVLCTALPVLLAASCNRVTSENIKLWKTTEKGPGRLEAALKDASVPLPLRAEACAAMVDIGLADKAEATLEKMGDSDRAKMVSALVPLYVTGLADPSPQKAIYARDALYAVRRWADMTQQSSIDQAMLPSIERELRLGRAITGRHAVPKLINSMGEAATGMLARLLSEPTPGYPTIAELLGALGNDRTREEGGANLVRRARNEKEIPPALWKALGQVGGTTATAFLLEKLEKGSSHDQDSAARVMLQRPQPESVAGPALIVAGNSKADKAVRDQVFGVLVMTAGQGVHDGLVRIIANSREEMVRYRAFDALLERDKDKGIVDGLDAFSASASYKKVDVDDLLVKLIEKVGKQAVPELVKGLGSKSPLTRVASIMALEKVGGAAEAAAVEKLQGDKSKVKGFPANETVGSEASRVVAALKKKV